MVVVGELRADKSFGFACRKETTICRDLDVAILKVMYSFSLGSFLKMENSSLTHICLMDLSIYINLASPFPILRVSGALFHFYYILNRNSCKQTV